MDGQLRDWDFALILFVAMVVLAVLPTVWPLLLDARDKVRWWTREARVRTIDRLYAIAYRRMEQ